MGISKKIYLIFFLSIGVFLILNVHSANAGGDDLDLTGIIKSVDANAGTVRIEVLNDNCAGIKKFSYSDTLKASDNIGKKVRFSIASDTCNGDNIHKIKRIYYNHYK